MLTNFSHRFNENTATVFWGAKTGKICPLSYDFPGQMRWERTWGNLHAVYLSCSTLLCNLPQKVSPLFSQPSFEIISIDREPNELLWLLWNYASKVQKPTSKRRITSNKSRLQKIEFKVGYSLEWDSFGPKYHHRISTSLNVAGGGETRGFDSRAFFLESFTASLPPSSWGLMSDPTRV